MSMFKIFNVAGSAVSAQSQRLNVVASNLANADTVAGPDGQAYKARQVVFQMTPQGSSPVGGVQVVGVQESDAPGRLQYDPGNPYADELGFVTLPNVDVVAETVNMLAASRSYQANVEVVNTARQLMMRTIEITKS